MRHIRDSVGSRRIPSGRALGPPVWDDLGGYGRGAKSAAVPASRGRAWDVPPAAFEAALERSAAKALRGARTVSGRPRSLFRALHLADLALGVRMRARQRRGVGSLRDGSSGRRSTARPMRSSRRGGAREAADTLYAELYGLKNKDGARQSLFHYFHGRSSLATWLRALVTQRYVDQLRAGRRHDPMPDEPRPPRSRRGPRRSIRIERASRRRCAQALGLAIAALAPRDRLRLGCYYAQG